MMKHSPLQLELFPPAPISLAELFDAYESCRRHKRKTQNAMAFELDYEQNLVDLCEEINNGSYLPGNSIAFIVDKPVKREIFAADFRDRVVHHLIINKLNGLFEKEFITDSYSCRKGKGTHKGIKRLDRFIRQCSQNYNRDCWILKIDIKGFFMSIDRNRLYHQLELFIRTNYLLPDCPILLELCRKVVFYDPAANCVIKGRRANWKGLPDDKSLFYSRPGCGLPIGNLTSQVFANFYLNSFDHFMKHTLGLRYYGRYVDDVVVVHQDEAFLSSLIPIIRVYLKQELGLMLHPHKIFLEHFSQGIKYLGVVMKPRRIYVANRTKANFYSALLKYNRIAQRHKPYHAERAAFQSSINSYLGLMKHYHTFTLRRTMLVKHLSPWWLKLAKPGARFEKFTLINRQRRRYNQFRR
jgi:RNA-directed DNA polymerase